MSKLSALSMAVLLVLAIDGAEAAWYASTGNNLTFINSTGGLWGGANDVTFGWDGSLRSAVVTDGTSNASLSSPTLFVGKSWTVHHMNMYGPGTYVFDTACPAGNPACGLGSSNQYTLVVPTGYIGAHMLINWSTSTNIDQVQLYQRNSSWNATGADPFCAAPLTTGGCSTNPNPNGNNANTIWSLVSIDTPIDSNPYHGTNQIDGPIQSGSFNFNLMTSAVPVPTAIWLLGSGLLGLAGVAKRRKLG